MLKVCNHIKNTKQLVLKSFVSDFCFHVSNQSDFFLVSCLPETRDKKEIFARHTQECIQQKQFFCQKLF